MKISRGNMYTRHHTYPLILLTHSSSLPTLFFSSTYFPSSLMHIPTLTVFCFIFSSKHRSSQACSTIVLYHVGHPAELKRTSIPFRLPLIFFIVLLLLLFSSDFHSYIPLLLSLCAYSVFTTTPILQAIMNGYDHMAMPYLPPNNNTTTDDYLTTLPAMGLAEQSFQTPTYSTDDFRRYESHPERCTVHHSNQSHHFQHPFHIPNASSSQL